MCEIEEIDVPLGIEIKGKVTGMDIQYEFTDEFNTQVEENKSSNSFNMTKSRVSDGKSIRTKSKNYLDLDEEEKNTKNSIVKSFDFLDLQVNRYGYLTFLIKNNSGIPSHFNISVKNYPPDFSKLNLAPSDNDLESTLFDKTINSGSITFLIFRINFFEIYRKK